MQNRGRYVFLVGTEDEINEAITNRASSAYVDHCVLRVRKLSMLKPGAPGRGRALSHQRFELPGFAPRHQA